METALKRIHHLVGPRGWLEDPAAMAPYLNEARGLFQGRARAVVIPASTAEVASVLRLCNDSRIGVVPQGGHTGRCGGAMPDSTGSQIILSLTRLNRIRALNPLDYTITVEAGCILADVQAAAIRAERLFPLSLGAEGSCQIGGNLATNAGGVNVLRYGNTRELTLGLEVVLADGTVWDGLTGLRKNNTGYDLKDLFIGAEGTLGVITAAVLKLFPLPREVQTALVALHDLEACTELLAQARTASNDALSSFELMPRLGLQFALEHIPGCRDPFERGYDWYVLLVFSGARPDGGLRTAMETLLVESWQAGLIQDAVLAASEAQARELWRLREGLVEGQRFEGGSIKHDISVPVSRVPEFIRAAGDRVRQELPGVRVFAFGHVGDGNIHFNLSQPPGMETERFLALWRHFNAIVHTIAVEMQGSFSAEHGIGRLKTAEMARYKSAIELALMRRLKLALDPNGILNPGKVLPETV
ncbi:MAG TPA: FAD-binding oxidoreductase [Candidatus Competibacteraceae bacterium]|nr:FAD-binding oxidoreductase [Candidatus Competibacteraceae bacterium]